MKKKTNKLLKVEEKQEDRFTQALLILFLSNKTLALGIAALPLIQRKLLFRLKKARQAAADIQDQKDTPDLAHQALQVSAVAALTAKILGHMAAGKTAPEAIEMSAPATRKIISTEVWQAFNQATIKSLSPDHKVKWNAVLDKKTCERCAALDGKEFTASTAPNCPDHPQCRCYLDPS